MTGRRSESGFYAVDRIVGSRAVLLDDNGAEFEVMLSLLPEGTREGSVLRVKGSPPEWETAALDAAERLRRLERARKELDRLKRSDPGGDIVL
jgi:hypothetical protein